MHWEMLAGLPYFGKFASESVTEEFDCVELKARKMKRKVERQMERKKNRGEIIKKEKIFTVPNCNYLAIHFFVLVDYYNYELLNKRLFYY